MIIELIENISGDFNTSAGQSVCVEFQVEEV